MFRPDPNGAHPVDDVIAKLTDVLADVPPDSPRAQKLAAMIRGLRQGDAGSKRKGQLRPVGGKG
jgi:hypothetical protein